VRVSRDDLERIVRPTRGNAQALSTPPSDAPQHLVLFYDDEAFLVDRVADFIGAALQASDCGLLVATPLHRERVEDRLAAAGVDVRAAGADGRYLAVDAQELLSRFMVGDMPDATKFR